MTEENGQSSAGLGFVGNTGAATEGLATIVSGVADLMTDDESELTFVMPQQMHQTYRNANQRGISEYHHVPSVKDRVIRDDYCDAWIRDAEALGDGRNLLNRCA